MADILITQVLKTASTESGVVAPPDVEHIAERLEPLVSDHESLAAYLESLGDLDEERMASYVEAIAWLSENSDDEEVQASYVEAWDVLTQAAKELEEDVIEGEGEELEDFEVDAETDDDELEVAAAGKNVVKIDDREMTIQCEMMGNKAKIVDYVNDDVVAEFTLPKGQEKKCFDILCKNASRLASLHPSQAQKRWEALCGIKSASSDMEVEDDELEVEDDAEGSGCSSKKGKGAKEKKAELATEPVVNPNELSENRSASFDLVLFGETSENPHYAVFMDGRPLASIHLADQERAAEARDIFTSADFADNVIESMDHLGVTDTLNAVNARFYHSVVEQGDVAARAASVAEQKLDEEYAERLAALKEDLLNTINLAVVASQKNQFVRNSLRRALKTELRAAGVVNAGELIDEVWEAHAGSYFESILTKAEAWLGYTPEGLAELSNEIMQSEGAIEAENTEVEAEVDVEMIRDQERQATTRGFKNVPLLTSNAAAPQSESYRDRCKRLIKPRQRFTANLLGVARQR
jgi:hypothetical protein